MVGASRLLRSPIIASKLPLARNLTSLSISRASLFGDVTESSTPATYEPQTTQPATEINPTNDEKLQQWYLEQAKADQATADKYISPFKRRLFDANVGEHGFFKNGRIVRDAESGKFFKVTLTPEEIDILEPTVYIQSYRLKLSMKKATVVNRFIRGWNVHSAINQLHFNPKKMATEVEKLLKRGIEQAQKAGIDESSLYIQAIWTGSDGKWVKRPDIKGRGRTGILEHPYIHVKAILKTDQTKKRIEWEKQQKQDAAKPRQYLNVEPLNFKVRGAYKW